MKKIGVISDTHDLLRPEVTEQLRGCDCILHGGDISSPRILDRLKDIAPVRAVRGNNDREWADRLPLTLDFELDGFRICMSHKKKDLPRNLDMYDLAVCGHTHQYACTRTGTTLILNPGSCGPRRFYQPVTMALVRTDGDRIEAERIDIFHTAEEARPVTESRDMKTLIRIVLRETQKGAATDAVARKYNMDPALAEQIARLYVTHPGVTVEGIMAKMGL